MSNGMPDQQVWVYFLLDRTGTMGSSTAAMERMLNRAIGALRDGVPGGVLLRTWVMSLGTRTHWIDASPALWYNLTASTYGCDLRRALDKILSHIKAQAAGSAPRRYEVICLINSEPAAEWEAAAQGIVELGATIHCVAFGDVGQVRQDTPRRIAVGGWSIREPQLTPESAGRVFRRIQDYLAGVLENARRARQGGPGPQAVAGRVPRQEGPRATPADVPANAGPPAAGGRPPSQAEVRPEQETPRPTPQASMPEVAPDLAQGERGAGIAAVTQPVRPAPLPAEGSQGRGSGREEAAGGAAGRMADKGPAAEEPTSRAEAPAVPPRTKEGGVATNWKEIEPTDPEDRVAHTATLDKVLPDGWRFVAASRRGKMHAHKGTFREDAFAVGEKAGWHMMVVCDGAGSCSLSRVGANLAAQTAVAAMSGVLCDTGSQSTPELAKRALKAAVKEAWLALDAEASRRGVKLKDLSTTFLVALHRACGDRHLLGAVQIGDGLIVTRLMDRKVMALGEPDVGEVASVTLFLTSDRWENWLDRVQVEQVDSPPELLAAMCDGVADDFFPYEQHLNKLLDTLSETVRKEKPHQALLDLLGYEKRGSFDDRTVAVLAGEGAAAQPRQPPAQVQIVLRTPTHRRVETGPEPEEEAPAPRAEAAPVPGRAEKVPGSDARPPEGNGEEPPPGSDSEGRPL